MRKIYPVDRAKIAANNATTGERRDWNRSIESEKERRASNNSAAFIPRKASHKQGWKLAA